MVSNLVKLLISASFFRSKGLPESFFDINRIINVIGFYRVKILTWCLVGSGHNNRLKLCGKICKFSLVLFQLNTYGRSKSIQVLSG
jgi:hypothetical protein